MRAEMQDLGRFLMVFGGAALLTGVVLYMGWGGAAFGWLGRLPGDIRIERENSRFYFPIVTSIVLSVVFSLILQIIVWLRGK